ncbi:membrane metallo-endopeptidase-like 1 [Dermacentor variabilis]|uniref:membrane metallo-endopeptidase-like 1 n=1 Tax=Dermacentor variabilis TaxID=34621 RepID=UPI003F5C8C0F
MSAPLLEPHRDAQNREHEEIDRYWGLGVVVLLTSFLSTVVLANSALFYVRLKEAYDVDYEAALWPLTAMWIVARVERSEITIKAPTSASATSSQGPPSAEPGALSAGWIATICFLGLTPGLVVSVLVALLLRTEQQAQLPPDTTARKALTLSTVRLDLGSSSPTSTKAINASTQPDSLVCHSDDCEYMSEKLRATLNFSIDPCDDFYQYVCGTIDEPEDLPFRLIRNAVEPTVVSQFYTESVPPKNQTAWQKAAGMFKTCFNLGNSEKSEVGDLKRWMISLNLDLAAPKPAEPYNSIDLMFVMSGNDVRWLDKREERERQLGQKAKQELYLSYLILYTDNRTKLREMFRNAISLDNTVLQELAAQAGADEKNLPYRLRDLAHFTTPLAESDQWDTMIVQYTAGAYNGSDYVILKQSASLILQRLVNSAGSEGIRYLVAWSIFRQGLAIALPGRLAAESEKTLEAVCYDHVKGVMESALTSQYLKAMVSMHALRETKQMVRRLADALRHSLEASQWLKGSRTVALKKLENMAANVGHPAQLGNAAKLEKYYSTFDDSTDSFFATWLSARKAYQHRLLTDQETYFFDSATVNAHYIRWANLIVIPAAILQPEIYFSKGPLSAAYGSLGQAQMHAEAHSRQAALNDTVDSENLADLGGTLMAFSAFDSLAPPKRDVMLPSLNLTARQLFFVFQCSKWCYYAGGKTGRHASGRYRCVVPAMNMGEFSEAFRCKSGDRMHPDNKCVLW